MTLPRDPLGPLRLGDDVSLPRPRLPGVGGSSSSRGARAGATATTRASPWPGAGGPRAGATGPSADQLRGRRRTAREGPRVWGPARQATTTPSRKGPRGVRGGTRSRGTSTLRTTGPASRRTGTGVLLSLTGAPTPRPPSPPGPPYDPSPPVSPSLGVRSDGVHG